jgi:hypothetical protein
LPIENKWPALLFANRVTRLVFEKIAQNVEKEFNVNINA